MPSIADIQDSALRYLQQIGIGRIGTDLFAGNLPPQPHRATCIRFDGGSRSAGEVVRFPTSQVLVRVPSDKYSEGLRRAVRVHENLDHRWDFLDIVHCRCMAQHEPGPVFRDGNDRYVFTINFVWAFTTGWKKSPDRRCEEVTGEAGVIYDGCENPKPST